MLTSLVTRLESRTQYSLISRLCSGPGYAVVWLQSPAQRGAQHFPYVSYKCFPASSSRTAARSFANCRFTDSVLCSSDLRNDGKRVKCQMPPPLIADIRS